MMKRENLVIGALLIAAVALGVLLLAGNGDSGGMATQAIVNRGVQYKEDEAHTSADVGTANLAVRQDTAATLAGTTGDYAPLSVDANGKLYVTLDSEAVVLGAGTASIGSITAGETHIGEIGGSTSVISVTLTLDTNIYAIGDVLAGTQEIANAMRVNGGTGVLYSVIVQDQDDQAGALDLVFLDTNCSIGTENATVNISDTCASEVVGIVEVSASDYVDLANSQSATKQPGITMKAGAGTTSLYMAAISRGTKTYTANGIIVTCGFLRD